MAQAVESARRKRFVPPKLVRYGALERITMASPTYHKVMLFDGGSTGNEVGFNNSP